MAQQSKDDQRPFLGTLARVGFVLVLLVIALPLFTAFALAWDSGLQGRHKGEVDEAIRDVLVALALIALGLILTVMLMGTFWLYLAARLKKLEQQLASSAAEPDTRVKPAP